jgi:hypothetical protein
VLLFFTNKKDSTTLLKANLKVSIVVQAYKPSTQKAEAGDQKFQASLGYTERPYFKNKTKY